MSQNSHTSAKLLSVMTSSLLQVVFFQSLLLAPLAPFPVLYVSLKQNRIFAALSLCLATIALFLLTNLWLTLLFFSFAAAFGWTYSEMIKREVPLEKGVLYVAMIFLLSTAFLFWIFGAENLSQFLQERLSKMTEFIVAHYGQLEKIGQKLGWDPEQLFLFKEHPELLSQQFIKQLPGNVGILILLTMTINTVMIKGFKLASHLPDLFLWKTPEPLIWVFIVSLASQFVHIPYVTATGYHLFRIVCCLYFLQGASIVGFYLKKKNVGMTMRTLCFLLILFFVFPIIGLGLFDLWLDVRRINRESYIKSPPQQKKEENL